MILKVKDSYNDWWMIDGLKRIHFGYSAGPGANKVYYSHKDDKFYWTPADSEVTSASELDVDIAFIHWGPNPISDSNPRFLKWACARDAVTGDEMFYVFDMDRTVFVLSDTGKTVDKI